MTSVNLYICQRELLHYVDVSLNASISNENYMKGMGGRNNLKVEDTHGY